MTLQETKTRRAEVKMAVTMVEHNIPFAFADHLSPLIKEYFKDSETAKSYKSESTKAACIINKAVTPYYKEHLVQMMKNNPYAIITDGSYTLGKRR